MTEESTIKFGLTEKQFKLINGVIISYNEIEKVLIFGSRSANKFRPSSDIDLAVIGKNLSREIVNRFASKLDDLPLPFMFDVLNYNQISNSALKKKIDLQGKTFFERQLNTVD